MAANPRGTRGGLAALAVVGLARCGPPTRLDRAPDVEELAHLAALGTSPPQLSWRARGHARLQSPEGNVEGELVAAVDLPTRLRVELRSRALFGLVEERLVLALPGDRHLLLYRARTDALERLPLTTSALARYLPTGDPAELHALVAGCPDRA